MEWVETTGRSVVEAMDAALDQLGVDEQEAEIQILDEPQKGLFGRLRVEARVRARVRPTAPRAKVERRDRGRRNNRRKGSGRQASTKGTTETKKASKRSEGGSSDRSSRGGGVATDTERTNSGSAGSGAGENQRSNGRKRRRRGGGRQGSGSQQQGAKVADNESTVGDSTGGEGPAGDISEERSSVDVEAQRTAVTEFLSGLVTAFGRPDAEVLTKTDDDSAIIADVQGDQLGLLVGPKGQTLQAVHELTRSVVQRRFIGEAHARLFLDVAGYRQRRIEALERFAQSVAEDVLSSGRSKALDPMPAGDRKVIHDVINTIDGVQTLSEGEEPERRVVIEKS